MDFAKLLNTTSPVELSLFVVFIIYLIFPVETPEFLGPSVDSPFGMIVMFCVTLYLFLYANPILGVLYIFVAYELLRRSAKVVGTSAYVQYTPSQERRDKEIIAMNPPKSTTLEEAIVSQMAPVGRSDPTTFVNSSYKPVADNNHNAFSV